MSAEFDSRVRIVISGIGMVTPCGADRESSWQGLIAGHSVLRWLTASEHVQLGCDPHRTRIAGAPAMLPPHSTGDSAALDASWMSAAAAREALEDADLSLTHLDRRRCGIVLGTSKGHLATTRQVWNATRVPGDSIPPGDSSTHRDSSTSWTSTWANDPAATLSAQLDFRGPVLVPVAACATGMLSICRGVELIRDGYSDVVLAGSVDDSLSEILWASYRRLGVMARVQDAPPETVCRPFDRDRQGFLMGSGAAVVVLERDTDAAARGHQPYAEWVAGGMFSDSQALTQVAPDAAGLTRLIQDVLRRGQVAPNDLGYINLHGTGTRDNDRYETLALRRALGAAAEGIPCSSLKGTIGHLLGAAGSVELAAMLLAMRDGIVPPTANLQHPDPECDLNYTPLTAQAHAIKFGLKLSLGFGGHLVAGLVRNCRL